MKYLFFIISFGLLMSCSNMQDIQKSENIITNPDEIVKEIAIQKLGTSYAVKPNANKDFSLVFHNLKKKMDMIIPDVQFFVYDNKKQKIILEDYLQVGTVDWISDNEIMVIKRLKQKDGTYKPLSYKFNVQTQKKE